MKKTRRILWLCLILVGQIYCARAQERFQSYNYMNGGSSSDNNILYNAVPSADGNYFACGYNYNSSTGTNSPFIVKIGYNGIGINGTGFSTQTFGTDGIFYNMTKDLAGNLIACGEADLSASSKFCLLKENQSGTVANYKYYDEASNFSNYSVANSVIETTVSGVSTGYLAVGTAVIGGNNQLMIVKVAPNLSSSVSGHPEYWQQVIPINGCQGVSVIQEADNDFVLLATMGSGLYVREFKQDGSLTGAGEYSYVDIGHSPAAYLSGYSIQKVSAGGGYIISGSEFAPGGLPGVGYSSLQLAIQSNLTPSWASGYSGGTGGLGGPPDDGYGYGVIQDASGNFVFATNEGNSTVLLETTTSGSLIGSSLPGYSSSSSYNSQAFGIFQSPDNDYVCAGLGFETGTGPENFYLLKVGNTGTNCNSTNLAQNSDASLHIVSSTISSYTATTPTGDGFLSPSPPYVWVDYLSSASCASCTPATVTVSVSPGGCIVSGASATLTATAVPGLYYQWYNASGSISGATSSTYTTTATGSYYVKGTWLLACSVTSNTVTVGNIPIADAGSNTTICAGDNGYIGSGGVTGVSYSWSPTTGFCCGSSSTDPYAQIHPATTGTTIYTLTATEGTCSASNSVSITVLPLPSADFTYTEDCSVGHAGYYNFSVTSPTPGATYSWYFDYLNNPSIFVSPPPGTSTISYDYSPYFNYNISYQIHLIVAGACAAASTPDATIVAGNSMPSSFSIPSPTYDCSTQTAKTTIHLGTSSGYLYATPDFTYAWSNVTSGFTSTTNVGSTTVTPSSVVSSFNGDPSVTQTFQLTMKNNLCQTFTPTPNLNVSPFTILHTPVTWNLTTVGGTPRCDFLEDEPNTFTMGSTGYVNITGWNTFLNSGVTLTTSTSGVSNAHVDCSASPCNVGFTPLDYYPSHLYTVYPLNYTWTDNVTGCTKTTSCNFSVTDAATIAVSPGTATVCLGTALGTTATVTWTTAGWANPTAQLYINWYSYAPTPGDAVSATFPLSSSLPGYLSSGSNTFTSSALPGGSGTNYYWAAICIHRSGMPDEIYTVSPPISIYANASPIVTLTGASTNISSPTHLCSSTYPDDFTGYGTITAAASGGTSPYTYQWYDATNLITPIQSSSVTSLTTNSFTPSTSHVTNYFCLLTDNNGCSSNQTAYYWDDDPTSVITGSSYVCGSSTTALTGNTGTGITSHWYNYDIATGAAYGTSLGGGSTYNAGVGTYQYFAQNSTGCNHPSAPFTVSTPPALTLSAGTYVPGVSTPISVNVPSGASTLYTNVKVYSGGSSSTATLTTPGWSTTVPPGYYWITYSLCGTTYTTNTVKVGPDCSSYTPNVTSPISTSSLGSGPNYFPPWSVLTIPGGVVWTIGSTSTLVMGQGSEIDIQKGGELILSGGTIEGCTQWRGILVEGDGASKVGPPPYNTTMPYHFGNLSITGGTISDAITAVFSDQGGDIQISGCTFVNNANHITIDGYAYDHGANISGCTFGNLITSSVCLPLYSSYLSPTGTQRMVYLEGVKGVNFENNSGVPNAFTEPEATSGYIGIETFNLTGTTGGTSAINIMGSGGIYGNTFDGPFSTCIASSDNTGGLATGLNIVLNQFGKSGISGTTHPTNGIVFNMTDASSIGDGTIGDGNDIENMINGIQFIQDDPAATSTTIEGNKIENNTYGVVIAPDDYPITDGTPGLPPLNVGPSPNTIELTVGCNKIGHNGIGIVGTGNIRTQGSSAAAATNKFVPTGSSANTLADLFWDGGSITYYTYTGYSASIPSTSISGPGIYMNNSTTTSTTSSLYTGIPTSNPSCNFSNLAPEGRNDEFGLAQNSLDSMSNSAHIEWSPPGSNKITVFPNPSTNLFYVQFSNPAYETWNMDITDVLGRTIIRKSIIANASNTIDASLWASGVYHLRMVNQEGKMFETRIEVQR